MLESVCGGSKRQAMGCVSSNLPARCKPKKKTLRATSVAPAILPERFFGEKEMDQLQQTIAVFERLRLGKYRITIENGSVVELRFKQENYHHLAGFQHLTDFPDLANPRQGKKRFYLDVRSGRLRWDRVKRSAKYPLIAQRIDQFSVMEQIMKESRQKIIVLFDNSILQTKIEAIYFLYQKKGTPYTDDYMVCMLFLGQDPRTGEYFPTTFVAEPSNRYLSGQTLLECTIERLMPKTKAGVS